MISLENVVFRYYEGQEPVIQGLELEISPGEILAVIGPNGSGKSTLAKLLNGLIRPEQGCIKVDGIDALSEDKLWEVRRRVGLILQNPDNQLVAPTVEDDVAFGPENLGVEPGEIRYRIKEALGLVGMDDYALWPPSRLSGGQKQRVAIAGVLAMKPSYLVLDEATSMLDPKGRKQLLNIIRDLRARGVGIVMITHFMNEAALADRIAVMVDGKLGLCGIPKEIFAEGEFLRAHGLDLPVAGRISDSLSRNGIFLPRGILTVDELVKALCC